jgi:hypothetical protein
MKVHFLKLSTEESIQMQEISRTAGVPFAILTHWASITSLSTIRKTLLALLMQVCTPSESKTCGDAYPAYSIQRAHTHESTLEDT